MSQDEMKARLWYPSLSNAPKHMTACIKESVHGCPAHTGVNEQQQAHSAVCLSSLRHLIELPTMHGTESTTRWLLQPST